MIAEMKPVKMRHIREEQSLSKSDLARLTKMQANLIGQIEEGRFFPYDNQLKKLADALGVANPLDLLEQVD